MASAAAMHTQCSRVSLDLTTGGYVSFGRMCAHIHRFTTLSYRYIVKRIVSTFSISSTFMRTTRAQATLTPSVDLL
ncbi:unnamed protein product [Sphagnum balticum]